jgi:class 3 adenylate cyclase
LIMGKELDSNLYKTLFGLTSEPAENKPLNSLYGIFGPPPADPPLNNLSGLAGLLRREPPAPLIPPPANNLLRLADLLGRTPPATMIPPPSGSLRGLGSILQKLPPVPPPLVPLPKYEPAPEHSVQWAQNTVASLLKEKPSVKDGRVLPGIEDLAIMDGRRVRAAFVYSDLHGFTKLVATQPESKSFVFLQAFVEIASQVTKRYGGEVIDVAGDRVLSVFHRPLGDQSNAPAEDAITFALWLQTLFNKAIGPAFEGGGLGKLSLGIGIDYGVAVVGCVGIRGNKRIVFLGEPANFAAKLQEMAGSGETVLSALAHYMHPPYLNEQRGWKPSYVKLPNSETIVIRITQNFAADKPPSARST